MDSLLRIAESRSPLPINKISAWFFKKHIELSKQTPDQISSFISLMFDFINKKPIGFSQKDWDSIRVLIIITIFSLFPDQSDIRPLPVQTEDGKLFNILLALHTYKNDHSNFVDQYLDAFAQGLKSINEYQPKTFYSRSELYYLQSVSPILKNTLKRDGYVELLSRFASEILHFHSEKLNINFITFATEMFVQSISFLKILNNPEKTKGLLASFVKILEISSSCPTILLLNFLLPWFEFVDFSREQKNQHFDINFADQIEMVSRLYEATAAFKNHELHRGFPWFIAFLFYGLTQTRVQKSRCVSLFCNAFASVQHLESLRDIPDTTKKIHKMMIQQIPTEGKWPIYHILSSLEMSIRLGISDLKKIHGITINKNSHKKEIRYVKFVDQIFEEETYEGIDENLSTVIEEVSFPDYESAKKDFDRQMHLLNSIASRLKTEITFQYLFIDSILESLNSADNNLLSTSYFYISNLMKLGIKLIIISSQRITMLEQFNHNEILLNFRDPSKPAHNIEEIFNFSLIAQIYIDFIERIPDKFYPYLATEISMVLFRAYQKRQLSYIAVKHLTYLRPEYLKNDRKPNETLYSYIICQLFNITSNYLKYFLSHTSSKSLFLYQWILFIFRLGMVSSNECHQCLKIYMKTFYKLIFTTLIINVNKISNQTFSMKLLKTYFHTEENELSQPYHKALPDILDDIKIYAKKDALNPILKIMYHELDLVNINKNFELLSLSLNSNDQQLIRKASDFCLAFFKNSNSNAPTLFNTWMKSITKLPLNNSIEMIQLLPKHSKDFNQNLSMKYDIKLVDEQTQINVIHLLNEILYNMNDSPEEISNLFFLIKELFGISINYIKQHGDYLQNNSIQLLLLSLCYCSNCDQIKEKVDSFSITLTKEFSELYKEHQFAFLLSLISIAGFNRSENSKYALNMIITFLKHLEDCPIEVHKLFVTNMFDSFSHTNRLHPMLIGLFVFSRFVPSSISIQTILLFLMSLVEQCLYDLEFSLILNKTLENFIDSLDMDQKVLFIEKAYELLSKTNLVCNLILLHRLNKMNIPLEIDNLESQIDENNLSITFQKISCCFSCGIKHPIVLTTEMKNKINEFIQCPMENVPAAEKWFRKMSFCFSLLYNKEIFEQMANHAMFLNSFMSFFSHSMSSKIPLMHKVAKKGFKKLFLINEKRSSSLIKDYCNNPDKLFSFFYPKYERIAFYRRLMKLFPDLIPSHLVHNFIKDINGYLDLSKAEKIKYLHNIVEFTKFFKIKEYIQREDVTAIILSKYDDNLTHLQIFIRSIQMLYLQDEIPFITTLEKYVMKFLKMFPRETIDFMLLNAEHNFPDRFLLLIYMIDTDKDDVFFNCLLDFFKDNTDYPRFPPSIFCILSDLSTRPKFASSMALKTILDSILKHLIGTVDSNHFESRGEFLFTHVTEISYSIINTFIEKPDLERVVSFTELFIFPEMANSYNYRRFIVIVFKNSQQEFLNDLIDFIIIENPPMSQKALEILLGRSLKYSRELSADRVEQIWRFISKNINQNQSSCILFIRYLIPFGLPKHHIDIYSALQNTIAMSDSQTVINSIKLSILLYQKKLLPNEIYLSICQQLFSYMKFFDLPFFKHTNTFLNLSNLINDELIMNVIYFTHDKFSSIDSIKFSRDVVKIKAIRDIMKLINVFTNVPRFVKYLPFSLLISVCIFLEKNLGESFEIDPLFINVLNFVKATKPHKSELERFISLSIQYIQILFDQKKFKEFPELFFAFLINENLVCDIKVELNENMCYSLALFGYLGVMKSDELKKKEYWPMISEILEYSKEPTQIVSDFFLRNLLDFIFMNVANDFLKHLLKIFDFLCENFNENTRNRLIAFSNAIVRCSCDQLAIEHLNQFFAFIKSLPETNEMKHPKSILYNYLVSSTQNLRKSEDRSNFLNFLIENVADDQNFAFCFISILPSLLFNPQMSTQSEILLNSIPFLFTQIKYSKVDEFISCLTKYQKKSGIDVTLQIISILLGQCKFCSISDRLIYLQKIINFKLPLEILLRLNFIFWSNDYLAITTGLFNRNSPLWCPLYGFSHRIKKAAIELAKSFINHIFNELGFEILCDWFLKIITLKPFKNFTNISMACLEFFESKKLQIPIAAIEKVIKYQNDQTILLNFLNSADIPSSLFTYPNQLNDSIFGRFSGDLSIQEATAVSLTILGEYEQAQNLLNSENPFVVAFSELNNRFLNDENTFYDLLKPFSLIEQQEDPILIQIGQIIDQIEKKEIPNPYEELFECENELITQIRKNRAFSLFEKERFIAIETVIQQIRKRLQNGKLLKISKEFDSSISPLFKSHLQQVTNYLTSHSQPLKTTIDTNSIPVALFSPTFSENFKTVANITSHNFILLSKGQIESYLVGLSSELSKNEIEFGEWVKFSEVSFNLLLIQPSNQFFQISFGIHKQIITSPQLSNSILQHQIIQRIFTLIKLAFSSQYIDCSVIKKSSIFNSAFSEIWNEYSMQIVELSEVEWFGQIVSELLVKNAYRSLMHSKNLNRINLTQFLNSKINQPKLNTFDEISNIFDELFELDYQKLFAQIVLNNSIEKADSYKQQMKYPTSLFEYAASSIDLNSIQNSEGDEFDKFISLIQKLNDLLPFDFPLRNHQGELIGRILKFSFDIKLISPNNLIIFAVTSNSSKQPFLIQKADFAKTLTFSMTLNNFKHVFKSNYITRIRNLFLNTKGQIEIGQKYLLSLFDADSEVYSLSSLFSAVMKIPHSNWILSHENSTINQNSLLEFILNKLTKQQFNTFRLLFVRALAVSSVVRFVYNLPYTKLDHFWFSIFNPSIQFVPSDFEYRNIFQKVELNSIQQNESAFRLSPNLTSLIGLGYKGELFLSFAATFKSILMKFEWFRSTLEYLIGEFSIPKDQFTCENLLDLRNSMEERIFELTPPSGPKSNEEKAMKWLENLMNLINQAENPDIQSPEAIPWF